MHPWSVSHLPVNTDLLWRRFRLLAVQKLHSELKLIRKNELIPVCVDELNRIVQLIQRDITEFKRGFTLADIYQPNTARWTPGRPERAASRTAARDEC